MTRKQKETFSNTALELIMWLIGLIVLIPFVLIMVNSVKTKAEANLMNLWWPTEVHWENYKYVWENSHMLRAFFNSCIIAVFSVGISTIVSALAAFVYSRNRNRYNKFGYALFMIGLVLPVNMLPTIRVLKTLNLMGTYAGIILLYGALTAPLAVFLYYAFIDNIPRELDEAAMLDGASGFQLFFQVIFPLLKSVTITVVVLNFVNAWNDFLTPLYILNSSEKWGMILNVYNYYGIYNTEWQYICAVIAMTLLPVIVVYIFGQKYIISGMVAGAVKG